MEKEALKANRDQKAKKADQQMVSQDLRGEEGGPTDGEPGEGDGEGGPADGETGRR